MTFILFCQNEKMIIIFLKMHMTIALLIQLNNKKMITHRMKIKLKLNVAEVEIVLFMFYY